MIFHYLSMKFPTIYCHWLMDEMKVTLQKCGAPKAIENHELERYVKTTRIFHKFLVVDETISTFLKSKIDVESLENNPMTLTALFIHYTSK